MYVLEMREVIEIYYTGNPDANFTYRPDCALQFKTKAEAEFVLAGGLNVHSTQLKVTEIL